MSDPRADLERLYQIAVAAAHPAHCLPPALPEAPEHGRIVVLAAGKAAGSMAEAAEQHYLERCGIAPTRLHGLAVTRHGYGRPTRHIRVVEAGHPVPDQAGVAAAEQTLALAGSAQEQDLVLVLVSGGASANWIAPASAIALADKQAVTRSLLRSGATIHEINTVRKHLSRIKGGRLAARAAPARIVTLAISDVPGDDPSVIGSGPTVPDPTTLDDARAVLDRFRIDPPLAIRQALERAENESPKPSDPAFARASYRLVARPGDVFRTVSQAVHAAGLECILLGERIEGEAREVAASHAAQARELRHAGRRVVLLSGGELTVTIRGSGRGGPNQEYALALALGMEGERGISALAADTDGTDGGGGEPRDPAGAFVDGTTAARARAHGLDPAAFLANNDSTEFFRALDGLLVTGPTWTNVNDFRAILVDGR